MSAPRPSLLDRPIFWSILQQSGRQLLSLAVFLVLASLLEPRDFGTLAAGMLWLTAVAIFSELGFSVALVQRPQVDSRHLSTTFFINVVLGAVLTAIGVAFSGLAARLFGIPEAQPVFAALSLSLIINSASLTQIALAQKELRFRDLAIRDLFAALVGGIIGIALALRGYGVWSLVAQTLVASAIATCLLWYMARWRPRAGDISLACLKDISDYSWKMFAYNIFKFVAQNIDRLLIGYLLGPVALGLYTFANKIVIYPIASLRAAVGAYLFPRFSRVQTDLQELQQTFLRVQRVLFSVVLPLMIIVGCSAHEFIPLVFGQKWAAAILLVQILAVVGVLQCLISPTGELMKALNHPGWLFYWAVLSTLITGASLWLGSFWHVPGIALGLAFAHVIGLLVNVYIADRLIQISGKRLLTTLWPIILSALLLGAVLVLVLQTGLSVGLVTMGLSLLLGVLVYMAMLNRLDKDLIDTFRQSLAPRLGQQWPVQQ